MVRGTIIGFDRIIRCNPAAVGYHLQNINSKFHYDGRLVDNLEFRKSLNEVTNSKLPIFFSVFPGLGRTFLGRKFDGFVSFTFVSILSGLSYSSFKKENEILGTITAVIGAFFWASDFYGTHRMIEQNNQKIDE